VVLELPPSVTADTAIKRRVEIAAGLDIDEFRVFLDRERGTGGSARRVAAWIADRDPYEAKPIVSPLATAKTWDFWKPFPFGTDARGRPVNLELVWSSLLVGAIPRQGKTYAARLPLAAAALDPHVRALIFDGKGGTDWDPFELVAHYYGSGVRLPVVEALISVLQDAVEDMNQRYERLRELPRELRPDGKVTPHITRQATYRMPLTIIAIDEVHRYLEHPEHGGTILALLTELAKVGPASGYMLVLATQRPDAKVIPAGLRDQIGTRFALKVMTWQSSEVILGAGTYGAGHDASKFLKSHKGVGILLGADDNASEEPATVRTHLLDEPTLWKVCERGRQLRIDRGTLTGMAAGESVIPDVPKRRLLDDLLDVFPPGADRAWSETLCKRLAEQWPDQYDGWDQTILANTLRAFDISTNRRGVARSDLLDAIRERSPQIEDARSA
jgi:S-DNA-T family DNA segregation ATPase FtsK/SpoIIIE